MRMWKGARHRSNTAAKPRARKRSESRLLLEPKKGDQSLGRLRSDALQPETEKLKQELLSLPRSF